MKDVCELPLCVHGRRLRARDIEAILAIWTRLQEAEAELAAMDEQRITVWADGTWCRQDVPGAVATELDEGFLVNIPIRGTGHDSAGVCQDRMRELDIRQGE